MKNRILRVFNFVLAFILACFGVSSTKQVLCMYGVPSGEFQISGRVENLKSKPIRKIEVEVQDVKGNLLGVDTTAKDGKFQIDYRGWPHREVYLISKDIDGCCNGAYQSDTTIVKLDYPNQGWNQGKVNVQQNITLKYRLERKNRKYYK